MLTTGTDWLENFRGSGRQRNPEKGVMGPSDPKDRTQVNSVCDGSCVKILIE